MVKTEKNPAGAPIEVFDGLRAAYVENRSQFYRDATLPFYGYNRPGAKISEAIRDKRWLQGIMGGMKAGYDCIKAFSQTDFTKNLKKFDVPTLILHGGDDQIVPIGAAALRPQSWCRVRCLIETVPSMPRYHRRWADFLRSPTERLNAEAIEANVKKVETEERSSEADARVEIST